MKTDPGSGRTRAASAEVVDLIRLPGIPYPEPEDSPRRIEKEHFRGAGEGGLFAYRRRLDCTDLVAVARINRPTK